MRPRTPATHRAQRGSVIIWTALFMAVMIACVALGVDAAKLMVTRTQLQNAADAAALAGASALNPATGNTYDAVARARATAAALMNKAYENTITPIVIDPDNDVDVDSVARTVTVRVYRDAAHTTPMVSHFAGVVGLPNMDMRATATAKADYASGVCIGIVPLAVQPGPGVTFQPGCPYEYILKVGGGSGSQGQYGAVQLPGCENGACSGMNASGANTYNCLMENGFGCCMDVGDCLPNESGNMSGPTKSAIQARFDRDTDKREGICYEEYTGNGARVVNVPITGAMTNGCYPVLKFASFFIKRIPGNGTLDYITAEFIDYVVPGKPGGGSGTTFAIRLIR